MPEFLSRFSDSGLVTLQTMVHAVLEKANALKAEGFSRFATAMSEFAHGYEQDAEREANRDPYGD